MRACSPALVFALPLLLAASACTPAAGPAFELLDAPIPANSQTPNLAVGDGRLYVSWVEEVDGATRLRFATYDGGAWAAAKSIPTDGELFVNWADFASIQPLGQGLLAAHYLQRVPGGGYAYHAYLRLSRDDGDTWAPAQRIHQDTSATQHGFVSLVAEAGGDLRAVWLDGREMTAADGRMRLMHRMWEGGHPGEERILDPDVCTCCQTAAVQSASGLIVAYRDRAAGEVRDIGTVRFAGGSWSDATTVHDDGWIVAGCPVNGPALDAAGSHAALAWFSAADGEARVLVSLAAGGAAFGPPRRVDEGAPLGRVGVVALGDGSVVVSWLESRPAPDAGEGGALQRNAEIRLRRLDPGQDPRASQVVGLTAAGRAGGFPRIARFEDRIFVAWTEPQGESSQVRVAALALVGGP